MKRPYSVDDPSADSPGMVRNAVHPARVVEDADPYEGTAKSLAALPDACRSCGRRG